MRCAALLPLVRVARLVGLVGVAGVAGVAGVVGVAGCSSDSGAGDHLIDDFDGFGPGVWSRMDPRVTDFPFEATDDALTMTADSSSNQHIVRDGIVIDSARPYFIEVDFEILGPVVGSTNSFAINFNQAGGEGDRTDVNCMSLNLDLNSDGIGGAIKSMGFEDGGFRQIDSRDVAWSRADTPYRYRIEVNRTLAGVTADNVVTATVSEAGEVLEQFEQDYSTFPYQVSETEPNVRLGLNSHGTNWRVSKLVLDYLD